MLENNPVAGETSQLNKGSPQYPQGVHQYNPGMQNVPVMQQNVPGMPNQILPPDLTNPNAVPDAVDQNLYSVMKQVVETKKGVQYRDAYGRPAEEKKKVKEDSNLLSQQKDDMKPLISNVQAEFKNLFNKDKLQNNSYRKRVLHLLIVVILLNCIFWQYSCMFKNFCYGENVEMEEWFSQTIFPMLILLIIFYIILFFSTDYLYKPGIQIMNILIIILMLLFIGFGIYGVLLTTILLKDINPTWNALTKLSQNFYNDDPIILASNYKEAMLTISIFYLVNALTGIIILILSYQFFYIINETVFDWRPPLRSRFHNDRAGKIIELYKIYNEEFRRLHIAENIKQLDRHRQSNVNFAVDSRQIMELPAASKNEQHNKEEEFQNSQQLQGLPRGSNKPQLPNLNDQLRSDGGQINQARPIIPRSGQINQPGPLIPSSGQMNQAGPLIPNSGQNIQSGGTLPNRKRLAPILKPQG